MRIIAGRFKGRRLSNFDLEHIRPTTDRVKESVFNILAPKIDGARVLDLYSGTGNLGLEALSRGASFVTFVESHPKSISLMKKNIELLQVGAESEIVKSDVLKFLKNYSGKSFDLVLIDPPFPLKICKKTLEGISEKYLNAEGAIVIEHSRQEALEYVVGKLERYDQRSYGDKSVSFFKWRTK